MKRSKQSTSHKKPVFGHLDWLEVVAILLGAWFVIAPYPYKLLFILLLLLPIAGLISSGITGRPNMTSLVRTQYSNGRKKVELLDFIDIPALALCIRVIIDFQLENVLSILVPTILTFTGLLILLFLTHKRIGKSAKKWWIYSMLAGNLFMYSYAAVNGVNCVFDNSPTEVYHAKVLLKYTSRRKNGMTYYVRLAPWGNHKELEDVVVDAELWSNIERNDSIAIDLKQGVLGIPWISVESAKINTSSRH